MNEYGWFLTLVWASGWLLIYQARRDERNARWLRIGAILVVLALALLALHLMRAFWYGADRFIG